MVKVVTDSSCDLPLELIESNGITFVPMNVVIDGRSYKEDIDITPREFWKLMSESKTLPKTSQPSPGEFADIFNSIQSEGHTPLCITISSKLSGTCQSAQVGAQLSGNRAIVFDSLAGSLSHGIQVIIASRMALQGKSVEEILHTIEEYRKNVRIIIPLLTLENIIKGGRLSKFQGSLANILNIRIILHGVEGEVKLYKKLRGANRFRQAIIDLIDEASREGKRLFGITHVDNPKDAGYFADEIKKRIPEAEVIIGTMGPTIATYAGIGGLILAL